MTCTAWKVFSWLETEQMKTRDGAKVNGDRTKGDFQVDGVRVFT